VCDLIKFGVYEVGEEDYICGEKNTMDFGPRLCHILCVCSALISWMQKGIFSINLM
jgi:hypothetical protein